MKQLYTFAKFRYYTLLIIIVASSAFYTNVTDAQSCPMNTNLSINSFPNTYFPATQATVNVGATSIILGSVNYGNTPISSGDILLVMQMQGAQINSANTSNYGDGSGTGTGYLSNSAMMAGKMEYVVATNSVPLSGGTLTILSGTVNSYRASPFSTDGQYTYQVIRVPVYYDVTLAGNIIAPRWDGATGGVIILYAINNINMAGYTVDASSLGFRGGGGRAFTGAGSGSNADFLTLATNNANGGKGEGIAGTPKYLNNNNAFLDVSSYEGYPNGSYGKGAPGNAGGGGTDGNPASNNDENTGGGGGANGGGGGLGGNAWSSNTPSGGRSGSLFGQVTPSRLIMGGGGGAGTTNNATGTPANGFASSGSAGGGVVIMVANNSITGAGTIKANGANANSTVQNDGTGGGGAGGSILIFSKNGNLNSITANANGGKGGNNEVSGGPSHGPGGGGGGGVIYSNTAIGSSTVSGGTAGKTNGLSTTYGATAGSVGLLSSTMTQSQTPNFPVSCVTLSVNFIDIAAAQEEGSNDITWKVGDEHNTKEYIVERSTDGATYVDLAHVAYKTSLTSFNQYTYKDLEKITGTGVIYYRVKEMEISGSIQYSKIVTVQMNALTPKLSVFPNPAKTTATVSIIATATGNVSLRLFDIKGSIVWQKQTAVSAGPNSIILDQLGNMPNGVYILQWFDGLKPQQVKLVVNH